LESHLFQAGGRLRWLQSAGAISTVGLAMCRAAGTDAFEQDRGRLVLRVLWHQLAVKAFGRIA